jgi:hypothetical protein
VLYDPTSDYLSPPLQAYRLSAAGQYEPIPPDNRQRLCSEQTGVAFLLDDHGELVLEDAATGELLLTDFEAEQQAKLQAEARRADAEQRAEYAERQTQWEREAKEAERQAKEAERQAKEAEREARLLVEARYAELEAELRRLRGQQES